MKKSIFVMLVLVTLLGCKTEPPETTELNGATYELEWEDNFEKNRIVSTCFDGSKHSTGWWIYQQDWGAARANSEYKIWASKFDDNVVLKDGKLKLTVQPSHYIFKVRRKSSCVCRIRENIIADYKIILSSNLNVVAGL